MSDELVHALLEHKNKMKGFMQPQKIESLDPDTEMDLAPPLYEDEDSFDEAMNDNHELGVLISQRNALRKQLQEPQISVAEQEKSKKSSQGLSAKSFKASYTVCLLSFVERGLS